MGVIVTGNFAKALWPGINDWYGKEYDDWQVEWKDLFDAHSSNQAYEEDVGISSFGLPAVKEEGGSIAYDEERQAYITRYQHTVYALGFVVTREAYEDNLYPKVGSRKAQGLARSMRQGKETVAANVYNRAFNTSYVGGDAATLVASAGGGGSASHPNFAGGTWTNGPSAAVDLSEAALEQACIDISKWTDDRGLKIKALPVSLHIPTDLQFEAERITMSPYRVSTADNDISALYNMGKFRKVVINHYFSDTDAWFIRTNVKNGMKAFQRRALQFAIDNDFDTENAKFKATERYSFGWTDPRGIWGTPGA